MDIKEKVKIYNYLYDSMMKLDYEAFQELNKAYRENDHVKYNYNIGKETGISKCILVLQTWLIEEQNKELKK